MKLPEDPKQVQQIQELISSTRELHQRIDEVIKEIGELLEIEQEDPEHTIVLDSVFQEWSARKLLRKLKEAGLTTEEGEKQPS